jgi:hypothetical protein
MAVLSGTTKQFVPEERSLCYRGSLRPPLCHPPPMRQRYLCPMDVTPYPVFKKKKR